MIEDICSYQIDIRGEIALDDLKTLTPDQLTLERLAVQQTRLTVRTDQAGMVGLIRTLHGLGFVILAIIANR